MDIIDYNEKAIYSQISAITRQIAVITDIRQLLDSEYV